MTFHSNLLVVVLPLLRELHKGIGLVADREESDAPPTAEHHSSQPDEHVLSIEENLSSICAAVDRLQRLARAIRLPGTVLHSSKAAEFSPSNEFESEQVDFEAYILQVIKHKFGGAPEAIQSRLSKANGARRKLFLYRRHRQEILSNKRHSSPERRSLIASQAAPESISAQPDNSAEVSSANRNPPPLAGIDDGSIELPVEEATTFAESRFQPEESFKTASSLGGTSLASFFSKSRLPLPPKVSQSQKYFECPYCYQLTSTKFLQKRNWRLVLLI